MNYEWLEFSFFPNTVIAQQCNFSMKYTLGNKKYGKDSTKMVKFPLTNGPYFCVFSLNKQAFF